MKKTVRWRLTTFQIISFGFVIFILVGALLLTLPMASRDGRGAPFGDCLFTAVSAVCVTGLVVRDTATAWSSFGQAVILLLIQVGGMGVVTAAVSISFISGKKIGLKQRSTMQEALAAPQVGGIVRLTRFILAASGIIELTGAVLLYPAFVPVFGAGKAIWYACFHSISAFCNAGFDLMGVQEPFSSLTPFVQHPLANLALSLLITVGGLGFLTWTDFKEHGFHWKKYRMQTRVILITSGSLTTLLLLYFLFFELGDLPLGQRIFPALFQSVTLRTAGFNTVDLNRFSDGGKALMILWMLIGGSPGSTAGGMKTTTVAVLLLNARAVIQRKENVECFKRRIADETARSAAAILLLYLGLFFLCGMVISRVEQLPLLTCLFETASAVGTVGVTLGVTTRLGGLSRALLMLLMFFGRVGGLTLIYAAHAPLKPAQGTMPIEKITVG